MNLELLYCQIIIRDFLLYNLISYANSNFIKDSKDYKLVIGYCFFLNGALVLWSSKKQQTIPKLTTKVEYIALGLVAKEAVWIKRFINELELKVTKTITLYDNNKMSIAMTKNVASQNCTKHIDV